MSGVSDKKTDFDGMAKEWDEKQSRVEMAQSVAAAMLRNLALNKQQVIMDYGAGTGLITMHMQPCVKKIFAVDTSEGMLGILREKISRQKIDNVEVVSLSGDEGSLPDKTFDVIVSSMTLHHVKDTMNIIRSFYNHLNEDGRIAVADLVEEAGDFHSDNTGVQYFGFNAEAMAVHFREAGFREVRVSIAHTVRKIVAGGVEKDFPIFLLTGKK